MLYGAPSQKNEQRMYLFAHVNIEWLAVYKDRGKRNNDTVVPSRMHTSLNCWKWCLGAGYVIDKQFNTLHKFVCMGNVALLDCLAADGGVKFHELLHAVHAARYGMLHVLQWLVQHGCSKSGTSICAVAASAGQLHCLQWAKDAGLRWDEDTVCERAAEEGYLDVLKWLHEHNCKLTSKVFRRAAINGHLHIVQWLQESQCPRDDKTLMSMLACVKRKYPDMDRWLQENVNAA